MDISHSYGGKDQLYCILAAPFYTFLGFDNKEASRYPPHCTTLAAESYHFQRTSASTHLLSAPEDKKLEANFLLHKVTN